MAIETCSLHYAEFVQPVQSISSDWSLKLTLFKSTGGGGQKFGKLNNNFSDLTHVFCYLC